MLRKAMPTIQSPCVSFQAHCAGENGRVVPLTTPSTLQRQVEVTTACSGCGMVHNTIGAVVE